MKFEDLFDIHSVYQIFNMSTVRSLIGYMSEHFSTSSAYCLIDSYLNGSDDGTNMFRIATHVTKHNPIKFNAPINVSVRDRDSGEHNFIRLIGDSDEEKDLVVRDPDSSDGDFINLIEDSNEEKVQSIEEFWTRVMEIGWADRDERCMSAHNIQFAPGIARIMVGVVSGLAARLEDVFQAHIQDMSVEITSLSPAQRTALWSHVIGKGQSFYEECMLCISLCEYLVPIHQDFLNALVKKAGPGQSYPRIAHPRGRGRPRRSAP
jgi:hypothetical protein